MSEINRRELLEASLLTVIESDEPCIVNIKKLYGIVETPKEKMVEISQEELERRYRIAPLEIDLHYKKPERDFCYLPETNKDAFPTGTKIIMVVDIPDRWCYGLLLTHKSWLKIKYGSYIPVLTTYAKVQNG
jgi:hypothetical protein